MTKEPSELSVVPDWVPVTAAGVKRMIRNPTAYYMRDARRLATTWSDTESSGVGEPSPRREIILSARAVLRAKTFPEMVPLMVDLCNLVRLECRAMDAEEAEEEIRQLRRMVTLGRRAARKLATFERG